MVFDLICKTKIFLYMMNVSFYSSSHFIRIISFLRIAEMDKRSCYRETKTAMSM